MSEPIRARPVYVRWPVWLAYAALLAIAIPWYWPADNERLFLGVPLWAAVSIGASVLMSVFTAWLLLRYWPDTIEATDLTDE